MDARFITPLRIEELEDGRKFLLEPLIFYSAELRGVVVVPAWFITDYASVPRVFQGLFPKDGPWRWAATLHDAGYAGRLETKDGQVIHLIKMLSDNLFREAMAINPRISPNTRELLYRVVRRFGGAAYGGLDSVVPEAA